MSWSTKVPEEFRGLTGALEREHALHYERERQRIMDTMPNRISAAEMMKQVDRLRYEEQKLMALHRRSAAEQAEFIRQREVASKTKRKRLLLCGV